MSLFHLFPVKIKEGMLLDGLCVLNVAKTNTSISLQQLDMVECMIVRVYYIYYTCTDNGCTGMGNRCTGMGNWCTGMDNGCTGMGNRCTGMGNWCTGMGNWCTGMGNRCTGKGNWCTGMGNWCTGMGNYVLRKESKLYSTLVISNVHTYVPYR